MSHQVVVTLTDAEFTSVKSLANSKGISLAQHIKRYAITDDDEFDARYDFLKKEAVKQSCSTPFTVMSLFGEEWEKIDRGVKLRLGRTFNHCVIGGKVPHVRTAGKTASRIQQYIVVKEE